MNAPKITYELPAEAVAYAAKKTTDELADAIELDDTGDFGDTALHVEIAKRLRYLAEIERRVKILTAHPNLAKGPWESTGWNEPIADTGDYIGTFAVRDADGNDIGLASSDDVYVEAHTSSPSDGDDRYVNFDFIANAANLMFAIKKGEV